MYCIQYMQRSIQWSHVCTGLTFPQSLLTTNVKVIGPRMIHQIHLFMIDQHL